MFDGTGMNINRLKENFNRNPQYFAVLLVLLLSSVGLTVSVLVLDVETAGGGKRKNY